MKRALALVLLLMLVTVGAYADTIVRIEENTVADFADFSLSLIPGAFYIEGERVSDQPFLVVVTRNEADDSELAFSVKWCDPFGDDTDSIIPGFFRRG